MIPFQRRNLSRCFLIGRTIVFSILLPLILKTTPFASVTTNGSNGVPINPSNSCCNLLHGNSDKLKRIHELRNESISNVHSLHDVLQKYRAWQTNYYLHVRGELRNKFEEARDDFLRQFQIILGEIVVDGEIDAMGREFIECVARSTWTRAVELLMCAWHTGREIVGMKILIAQVFEILHQTVEGGRHLDWEFHSTPKHRFFR